jgi:hypothetical protein
MQQDSQKLIKLLEDSVNLYKKDREMAIENYNALRAQLDYITKSQDMSEEGVIEAQVNKALENVFKSGQRLDNVIQTLSKILINSIHADSKIQAARAFSGMIGQNEKIIDKPVDLTKLLNDVETINIKEDED